MQVFPAQQPPEQFTEPQVTPALQTWLVQSLSVLLRVQFSHTIPPLPQM